MSTDQKEPHTPESNSISNTPEDSTTIRSKQYDVALDFIQKVNVDPKSESDDETAIVDVNNQKKLPKQLLRKLDLYMLPLLCTIYFFQFLDKALLNYSAVMGIKKNLVGNQFANLGTIFNVAYIVGEPVCGYLLQKYPLSKIFSTFIILWGITVCCHAACHTYAALMVVRVILGFLESSTAVALIAISGQYFNKSEQAQRIGYWCVSSGTATMFGGLMSFAFQHIKSSVLQPWQILFLVFGALTIVFGFFVFFYLPDNVTSAWFLNDQEKLLVLEHVRTNQTGVENKKFKKEQIKELLFEDKLTWIMVLLTMCSQIVTGAVGTFSVTITSTFGFDNYVSALLQLPTGAVIIICILSATQLISKFGHFTLIHVSMYIPSVVGCILLITLDLDNSVGNLIGLYLIYSGSCAITLLYLWNSYNTAGYTKKIFRNALTMMSFAIACIIGPQLFRDYSYPRYIPAKIVILVTQCAAIPLTLLVGYLSKKENEKRDRAAAEEGQDNVEKYHEFRDLTDIENRNFRYTY